jgi:hypothetical protein
MFLSNLNTFRLFYYRIRKQYMNSLRRILGNKIEDLMFVNSCVIVQFIKKNSKRCNNVLKFYYSILIWSSTYFGRHTAYHQEPKTALAASVFLYVEGCWTSWWTLCNAVSTHPWHQPAATLVNFTRCCKYRQVLLIMGENIAWNT